MKKLTLKNSPTLLVWALLTSPLLQAQELTTNTGVYLGISGGETKGRIDNALITQGFMGAPLPTDTLSQDKKATGYKALVGFPINPNWAIEAGYFDLGRLGFSATRPEADSLVGSTRIKGVNLDVVGTLPITDSWSLLGRVGAAYAETKNSFTGNGLVTVLDPSPHKRQTNYKYGLGTQYAFTPEITLRLEGERYRVNDAMGHRANVDLMTLGLVYRFGGPTPVVKSVSAPYVPAVAQPVDKPTPAPTTVVVVTPAAPAPVVSPAPTPAPQPRMKVKLAADSLFGFDQDSLQADGKQALDKLLTELKDVNVERVQVTGHTDRLGAKAYNDKLSTRRAEAVRNYLVQVGGMSASKISAVGMGAAQPESSTNDCKGMKASQALITCLRVDRRVDVEVMGSQQQR
jgi:OOP family OmpA-OmpF porin